MRLLARADRYARGRSTTRLARSWENVVGCRMAPVAVADAAGYALVYAASHQIVDLEGAWLAHIILAGSLGGTCRRSGDGR